MLYSMAHQIPRKPGRPFSGGETAENRVAIKMKDSELAMLDQKRGDVPRATFFKRLLKQARPTPDTTSREPVRVAGRLCAGEGVAILETVPGEELFVRPTFQVPANAVAYYVEGDSFERPSGRGEVVNGSIVYMVPGALAGEGDWVHVEYEPTPGERLASLKIFDGEEPDGGAWLRCLNPNRDRIYCPPGTWSIKAKFFRHDPPRATES